MPITFLGGSHASAEQQVPHQVLEELSNRETSKRVLKESFEESSKKLLLKDSCRRELLTIVLEEGS